MATYDYDIANMALARLGQGQITSLGQTGRDAEVCNLFYAENRDFCLTLTDWITLTTRVHLVRAGKIAISKITQASPCVLTCSGHVYTSGMLLTVEDALGMTEINDGVYVVKTYTATSITLYTVYGSALDATSWAAYTSGGYAYMGAGANWQYVYDVPTDCTKFLTVLDEDFGESETYTWMREKDDIYTNVENAGAKYIKTTATISRYSTPLIHLMAARLAWCICPRITNDQKLLAQLYREWMELAALGRMENAERKVSNEPGETLWVNAR